MDLMRARYPYPNTPPTFPLLRNESPCSSNTELSVCMALLGSSEIKDLLAENDHSPKVFSACFSEAQPGSQTPASVPGFPGEAGSGRKPSVSLISHVSTLLTAASVDTKILHSTERYRGRIRMPAKKNSSLM